MSYKSPLYLAVLFTSLGVLVIILGPGLYSDVSIGQWYGSWQREMFSKLCHQQIDRSFHMGHVPMVVCSRCFGIYSIFALTIIVIPYFKQTEFRSRYAISLVLITVLINVIDSMSNSIGIWENTLSSRFLAGATIGFAAALLIGTDNPKKIKELINNGTK
jgi:uncharacterized membrane protein